MKSKFYIIASILAVICLICSCGGGSGSDGEAQKTAAVSFAVSIDSAQRSISATSTDLLSTAVYQYKASANWTSEFGTVQGTQTEWTDFTVNDSRVGKIGYFAVGSWTFHVRVMDVTKSFTLYQTVSTGVVDYVNTTNGIESNPIEIQVSKVNEGTGTIKFGGAGTQADPATLKAPTCGENEALIATYGKVGTTTVSGTVNLTKGTAAGGFTPFTGTATNVASGVYWVTITRNDGANDVGASTTMVEIYSGKTETISGTVESGKWIETFFEIKGIKTISGTIKTTSAEYPYTVAVTQNNSVTFNITGEIEENGSLSAAGVYYLCVNGARNKITPNNGSYSWSTSGIEPGNYEVSLIVADAEPATISASAPKPILVTVNPAPPANNP